MSDLDLLTAGRNLEAARTKLEAAKHRAADAAEKASAGGMSEVEIARRLGVNRLTVRKWLGK
jgi:transposase